MKQIYSNLLLLTVLLVTSYVAHSQVYWVSLSGPAEATPNNSPGIGKGLVTIDMAASTMRVQTSFSGLVGNTTASHIHAPTAAAGTGAAGVATTTPTFPGFPLGVTSGSYDQTFNMLLNSSYNPAYVAANGGTAASAFAALTSAISAGKSYLNIHSTVFPGGEIRGFLIPCPAINVSIPDAFALPGGVLPNTVYPAYLPASSLTLAANVSGGTGSYNYNWSNGATTNSITVSPTATATYSLNVTDQNGCPGSASKTVNVRDISGGNKGDKIVVCHNGHDITIATPAVSSHLQHGDMLGSCEPGATSRSAIKAEGDIVLKVLSNPSPNYFDIQLQANAQGKLKLTVYDNMGRVIETRSSLSSNQTIRLGNGYKAGVYLVEIVRGAEKQTLRLVKTN